MPILEFVQRCGVGGLQILCSRSRHLHILHFKPHTLDRKLNILSLAINSLDGTVSPGLEGRQH